MSMLHGDDEEVRQVEGHSGVVPAVVAQQVEWQNRPGYYKNPVRNRITGRLGARDGLAGQGVVRIEEAGVELVAVADSAVELELELRAASVVRARAGMVCVGLVPRQAHLR